MGDEEPDDRSADAGTPPSALERLEEINAFVAGRRLAVFLDYDGTVTPIVSRPEEAILSESMRSVLRQFAELCTVAIVSGRDLPDVQRLVDIDAVFYAGSHGFDIAGPKGLGLRAQQGREFLPILDQAEKELNGLLDSYNGGVVERKRFSLAWNLRALPIV